MQSLVDNTNKNLWVHRTQVHHKQYRNAKLQRLRASTSAVSASQQWPATTPADWVNAAISLLSGSTSAVTPQVASDGHAYDMDVTKQ